MSTVDQPVSIMTPESAARPPALRLEHARLVVFAKAPVPGWAKTRLVPMLGQVGAARLHARLTRWTLEQAGVVGCPVELWCAPDAAHPFFAACRRDFDVSLRTQRGSDLGERMRYALRSALRQSAYAVLTGTDCPGLTAEGLRQALAALHAGADVVLGPAEDGGYVLIGARQAVDGLFSGIEWGSAGVLKATRDRLRRLGLRWCETKVYWDVDRPADVRRLWRESVLR